MALFFQMLKERKFILFKIFLVQILLLALAYFLVQNTFKTNHPFSYLIVTFSSLFVMFLGARFSTYLIALGKTRTLFKVQGLGSITQLVVIMILGQSDSSLLSYIPVLALPNMLVMIPVSKDWSKTRRNSSVEIEKSNTYGVSAAHLSLFVQIVQFLQLLQGFAIPLILSRIYDGLLFATVITQYRICIALLSSVGTLALSEWSSINQDEIEMLGLDHIYKFRMVIKLLEKYLLLIVTIVVSLPVFGTFFWESLSSKFPNPPLISWFLWGLVLIFYEVFTILSIVETRLKNYELLLYMNSAQVLVSIGFFCVDFLQSASTYPLNFVFSYIVAILGVFVIRKRPI
jgi:hypothetical protein